MFKLVTMWGRLEEICDLVKWLCKKIMFDCDSLLYRRFMLSYSTISDYVHMWVNIGERVNLMDIYCQNIIDLL